MTRASPARDPGRPGLLDPLFRALAPSSVLVCRLGEDPDPDFELPDGARRQPGASCTPDGLGAALDEQRPEVLWLRGHTSWHGLRAVAPAIVAHALRANDPPVLVVEGPVADPLPPWSSNQAYAEHLERLESVKAGVRLGLDALAAEIDADATRLWCAPGRGTGVVLPAVVADRLRSWLDGRADLLAELGHAHDQEVRLVGRTFELFEHLDRAQRAGTAVVKSLRFRVGTRVVRLGRRLTRKEAVFRAPREILARRAETEKWRTQLASERDTGQLAPAPGALRVTYVLPELRLSGGGLVVSELVNEMRLQGADARIAALRIRADVYRTRFFDRPLVFESGLAMLGGLPDADVVVATHWSTAAWVRDLVDAGRAKRAAYFVQDYEAWFYGEDDEQTRAQVRRSYDLIADKIVTSAWLADLLARDGHTSRTIPPGVDLDVFYPRPAPVRSRPMVLAMARPRTPRRGFDTVVSALTEVHELAPSVEIVLFGERLGEMRLPFPFRGEGVITGQEQLARVYSQASVHFDGSDFQAFGRAALEGMACGAVPVLTNIGGVNEYARDGDNCLLVPPRDPRAAARAIVDVVSDERLHERLRAGGLATVPAYSMRARAREMLACFAELAR